jgi:hypothetical protein
MLPERAAKLYTEQLPAIRQLMLDPWLIYVYEKDRGRDMKPPNVVAPQDAQAVIDAAIRGGAHVAEAASARK